MQLLHTSAFVVFWGCAALIVYAYMVYPVLLVTLGALRRATVAPPEPNDADLPSVSVLVVAHNEESVIRERIDNLLALDYPKDRLELVIASDSSRDRTADIVNEYSGRGIQLIAFTERTGKSAVLDAVIPRLKGSIAVLSDANTMMEPSAVRRLVRWFQNPRVGVVCGKLVLTDPVTGTNVDSLYWRFETLLKRSEGRLGALLGANGGIYAIRRSVFHGLSHDTIVDDFVIPLLARVRTGCAIIYDESAIAYEETPPEIAVEFRRRARIGAGGFQSLGVLWPLLDPRNGWIALTFFSHKVLRWLCPFFLLGLAVANLVLVDSGIYGVTLLVGLVLAAVALLGQYLSLRSSAGRALRLTTMFATMNAALLVGFFRWASGRQRAAWDRTAR
jgi:cellulose synthase/poly-beta-1,6-N-acetylglucosamine synthase-like glycosyltransferase